MQLQGFVSFHAPQLLLAEVMSVRRDQLRVGPQCFNVGSTLYNPLFFPWQCWCRRWCLQRWPGGGKETQTRYVKLHATPKMIGDQGRSLMSGFLCIRCGHQFCEEDCRWSSRPPPAAEPTEDPVWEAQILWRITGLFDSDAGYLKL